jgi:hypothetical protein
MLWRARHRFLSFWQCTDHDPWAAATRLVDHCKFRRDVFGNQAFLPMVQGRTLPNEDVAVLRRGLVQILPDDTSDRPVL